MCSGRMRSRWQKECTDPSLPHARWAWFVRNGRKACRQMQTPLWIAEAPWVGATKRQKDRRGSTSVRASGLCRRWGLFRCHGVRRPQNTAAGLVAWRPIVAALYRKCRLATVAARCAKTGQTPEWANERAGKRLRRNSYRPCRGVAIGTAPSTCPKWQCCSGWLLCLQNG